MIWRADKAKQEYARRRKTEGRAESSFGTYHVFQSADQKLTGSPTSQGSLGQSEPPIQPYMN